MVEPAKNRNQKTLTEKGKQWRKLPFVKGKVTIESVCQQMPSKSEYIEQLMKTVRLKRSPLIKFSIHLPLSDKC